MTRTEHPTTTHDEQPCPDCDQTNRVYWVSGTPGTDTWACRDCGTEQTITVDTPGVV